MWKALVLIFVSTRFKYFPNPSLILLLTVSSSAESAVLFLSLISYRRVTLNRSNCARQALDLDCISI